MAARFWVNGGITNNWSDTANWSLTSGAAGGQAAPTSIDDVTFDIGGNLPCTLNVVAACKSLTFTVDYSALMTFTNGLTVTAGGLTLATNVVFAGAGTLSFSGACTATSNGKVFPQPVVGLSGFSLLLVGDFICAGLATLTIGAVNRTVAERFVCRGGLLATTIGAGSAIISIQGGSVSTTSPATTLASGVTIQIDAGVGTVTFATGLKLGLNCIFSYVSGVVVYCAGFVLTFNGSATLDNWSAYPMPNATITSSITVTITGSQWGISGTLTLPPVLSAFFVGTFGWTAGTVVCMATSNHTLSLKNGCEYICTVSFGMGASAANFPTITSTDAALLAKLTFRAGCAYDLSWATITRIDCSNGPTVYASHCVLTSCVNVVATGMPLVFSNFFSTLLTWGNGQQANVLRVKLGSVFGGPCIGLNQYSAGLVISTIADNEPAATVYSQAANTIDTIPTLGTFTTPVAGKCRFREVDSLNHPGVYELQLDDSRYAVPGATALALAFNGAMFLSAGDAVIELVQYKPQDPMMGLLVGAVKKNTAFPNFAFPMFDATGALKTGLTVTAALRKDAGSFATASGTVTEIGTTGWYTVDLVQAETNAKVMAFSATASGAVPTCTTIITQA